MQSLKLHGPRYFVCPNCEAEIILEKDNTPDDDFEVYDQHKDNCEPKGPGSIGNLSRLRSSDVPRTRLRRLAKTGAESPTNNLPVWLVPK